ncbi:hypothetical protein M9Y10_031974 [Tritrichomonas musculus]|uniref:Protein kinase domain-containing protein n=1 Tax=Tritrichomonas musculus TaxID=1915356 RepID=A0ABR2H0D2_9EUKA
MSVAFDFGIYFIIFDEEIIIIDQNDFTKIRPFFQQIQGQTQFFFFDDNSYERYQNTKNGEEKIILNEPLKIKRSKIKEMIFDCIISKSQQRTRNRRYQKSLNNHSTENKFNHEDFVVVKYIKESASLSFHAKDQFLYFLKKFDTFNFESKGQFEHEINFYERINNQSQFISKYFGSFRHSNKSYIVAEYIEGQTLSSTISQKGKFLSDFDKLRIVIEIMISVEFVHLNHVILRDLNFENIIVDQNNDAVLIDFDRSTCDDESMKTGDIGISYFTAPEQFSSNEYSFKSDIYSLGKIICFILTETLEMDSEKVGNNLKLCNADAKYEEEYQAIKDICIECIEKSPEVRPNIIDILNRFLQCAFMKLNNEERSIIEYLKGIHQKQFMLLFEMKGKDNLDIDKYVSAFFDIINEYENYISNDIKKTIEYLEIAAHLNNSNAQFILGYIYLTDEYNTMDVNKSIHYLELSSNLNNPMAQFLLSSYYLSNENIISKGVTYLKLSAGNNYQYALNFLGYSYFLGEFVEQDINKSIYYLEKAADQNLTASQYLLGVIYHPSENLVPNVTKSIHYLTLAAEKDNEDAQLLLGKLYLMNRDVPRDLYKSIHYLTLACKHNNPQAQYCLGKIYSINIFPTYDIDKSVHYLTLAAHQNNTNAQCLLGRIYLAKNDQDEINKSVYYLTLAANQNICRAQLMLGLIYYHIFTDANKAIYYLTLAASQNNAEAMHHLGVVYYQSDILRDKTKSIHFLTQSAEQDYTEAQCLLGFFYYCDEDIYDIKKAIHYLTIASNKNHPVAHVILGHIYCFCCHVPRDVYKGIYYLTLASNQDDPLAHFLLGDVYLSSKEIPHDIDKALIHIKIACDANYCLAQYALGVLYYKGTFIKENINKAIHYLQLSASQQFPEAQYLLGAIYFLGKDVPLDINKAIHYLKLSSTQKNSQAQFLLGLIYYTSNYVPRNINLSIYYLTLASNQNNHQANYLLGEIYYSGLFVERDIDKAIHHFKEASCFNNAMAKNELGVIYKNGEGVKKNIYQAIEYFEEAIRHENDSNSFYNLIRIYYFGIDIQKDIDKSIEIIEKASEFNYPEVVILSYFIYLCGDEKSVDKNKAFLYLERIISFSFINNAFKDFFINLFDESELINFYIGRLKTYDIMYSKNESILNMLYYIIDESIENNNSSSKNNKKQIQEINHLFYEGFND